MRITMKQLSAGPSGVRLAGKSYPVDPAEGKALVAAGFATVAEVDEDTAPAEEVDATSFAEGQRTIQTAEAPDRARRAVDPKQAKRGRRGE